MDVDARLAEMGLTFPQAPAAAANYVPFVRTGNLLHVSGQVCLDADGGFLTGKCGDTITTEEGAARAQSCALGLLAQVRKACDGDWSAFDRVVKLVGFVNSTPGFGEQPMVINGASNLLVDLLGEQGRHARSAVSAGSLPFGVTVEIEGVFALK